MNYYFITGTSSGIGKALVENLVKTDSNKIVGYARRKSITHSQYCHQVIDLSDINAVQQLTFPALEKADKIVLINNAGTLGDIKHFGDIDTKDLVQALNVNTTSLAIMTNTFIKEYQDIDCKKIIINISSGAASSPYDGW
ncbi:MAG: SDR family NAD(P)-dependent oxidoreductase, partial [Chitinophagales bacterium]